jgi:epoxide hydrolase-like predicted phosphatase
MIKAVIFDMGGVLLRTEAAVPRQQLAEQLGITRQRLEGIVFGAESARRAEVGEISHLEHWELVRQALGISVESLPAFIETFWSGDAFDTSLVEFINSLRPRWRTGLLSNAWIDARSAVTQRYPGLMQVFDESIFSAEVGMRKPDPRVFALIVKQLGVEAAEAVFVDDFEHNILAAQACGLKTVWFKNTPQAIAEVKALLGE